MNLIETERLYIRNFHEEDWKDMYEYFSDSKTLEFEPYEPFTVEQCKAECINRAKGNNFYGVCLKKTNKLIGNLFVDKYSEEFNTWEIGYIFNSKYHRNGYGSESTKAIVDYLFKEKDARRIIAMCDPLNIPSWKLLERIGMKREAHFKKEIYFKKDENNEPIWKDTYIYAILRNDVMEK